MPNPHKEDSPNNSATPMQATATKAALDAKPRYQSSGFYSVQNLGLEHLSSRRIKLPAPDGVGDEYYGVVTYELLPDPSKGKGKYLKLNHRTVGYICGGKAYGEVCFTDKEFVQEHHLEELKIFRREGPGPYGGKGNRQGHFVYTKDEGNNSSYPYLLPTGISLQAGAVCLINCVAQQLGITSLLQELWPKEHLKILSIVDFLCTHQSQSIYNFEATAYSSWFPKMQGLKAVDIEEIFYDISSHKMVINSHCKMRFIRLPLQKQQIYMRYEKDTCLPFRLTVHANGRCPDFRKDAVVQRT